MNGHDTAAHGAAAVGAMALPFMLGSRVFIVLLPFDVIVSLGKSGAFTAPRCRQRVHPYPSPDAVTACMALANIVKSSLGPVGLDKMLVRALSISFVTGGDEATGLAHFNCCA